MHVPFGAYRPALRMLGFIEDLGRSIDSAKPHDETAFRDRIRTALKRLDDMFIGDRHRFLLNVAESTGHAPRDIVRWPTGGARLPDPAEWARVLRAIHRYLFDRYAPRSVAN